MPAHQTAFWLMGSSELLALVICCPGLRVSSDERPVCETGALSAEFADISGRSTAIDGRGVRAR
jgi:hypothetical protein